MEILYKPRAANAILKVAAFVESKNTTGSGLRWFEKLDEKIFSVAQSKTGLLKCKHHSLAKFGYRCYEYKGWIIAFRISGDVFEVSRFIWAARLS